MSDEWDRGPRAPRRWLLLAVVAIALAAAGVALLGGGRDQPAAPPAPDAPTPALELETGVESTPAPPSPADEPAGVGAARLLPDAPIPGRAGAASAFTGSEVLIWGGGASDFTTPDLPTRGAAYDVTAERWRLMADAPLDGRTLPASAWTGEEWVLWGGVVAGADGSPSPSADGAAYDPEADAWKALPEAPLEPRGSPVAAWTGREVAVWGGTRAGSTPRDVAAFDPADERWRDLPALPDAAVARGGIDGALVGGQLVAWDGTAGWALDPDGGDAWRRLPDAPLTTGPRGELVAAGDQALVAQTFVGGGGYGLALDAGHATWEVIPDAPLPHQTEPRAHLWTGDALLVIGLAGDGPSHSAVWREGSWSRLAPSALDGRTLPVAVWAGDQALVWGGFEDPQVNGGPTVHHGGVTWDPAG